MENQTKTLNACLRAVWSRTQKKHISAGLLAMCSWAILIFLIGVLVDRFAFLPTAGRWIILIVLLSVAIFQAWKHGLKNLRGFDAMRSAKEIESQKGELDSLIVTALQFRDSGATPGTSSSLWQATLQKAEDAAKGLRVAEIVHYKSLQRPLRVAGFFAILVGIFAIANGPFLAAGLARIFSPWSVVSYPTKTQIKLGDRVMVLKEGEATKIDVRLTGVIPETAELELVTGEGRPKEIDLEVHNGTSTYAIASASRDFRYRIKAGDARSYWHDVRVIPAPRIDDVKVLLDYPAYLDKPQETVGALTLSVPEGTRVKWQLTLDQPISKAVLNREGQDPLELEVRGNGRELVIDELVQASRGYSFSWVEKNHGFEFTSPRYHMQVASDQAPRVELVSPVSNVVALLGRQLDLTVRAQDDHGIGSATITYRVNLRPEKTMTLAPPLRNGEGEQKLDWDYTKEISDLKIGDTVSFVVEVSDRYPAPQGPHLARSETRRITFLSREDYLLQIEKKLDRLLSKVRAIYRQERAAHVLVSGLDGTLESFSQTCQLEAIRQEMLREQIKGTAAEVRLLLADLAANHISDAVENEALKKICAGLDTIADESIAQAANSLRDQARGDHKKTTTLPDLSFATAMVNKAARGLGGIVLQRDIDAAREVFALELQMLAREQATLRYRSVDLASSFKEQDLEITSKHQIELAAWTESLLADLDQGMRYDKRPLAVLGLMRRMTEIRKSGAVTMMKEAAALIAKQEFLQAAEKQALIIKPLLKAEFSVRTGSEYAATTANRDLLASLLDQQVKLRSSCETMTDVQFLNKRDELVANQKMIRERLLKALIASIPAPRALLFDQALPMPPPIDALRTATENGMNEVLELLDHGQKGEVIAKLQTTEKSLKSIKEILTLWSAELGTQTQGLTSLVSISVNRLSRIEECENRQIALLEAALDNKPIKPLAESQRLLANDMIAFKAELLEQDKENPSKDIQPLLNRIDQVIGVLTKAAVELEADNRDVAMLTQEEASDALIAAKELIVAQGARLALLQDIFTFRRSVSNSYEATVDVVDQQNDLIKATEGADEDQAKELIPSMKNLLQCLTDVAPLLDAVAARLDAGSALLFASSDLEDALAAIEDGDMEDALDAQEVAAESLGKVKGLVQSVREQTTYLAEIIEFLHQSMAALSLAEADQQQIRLLLEAKPDVIPAELIKRLEELQKSTATNGFMLQGVMGELENYKAFKAARLSAEIEKLKNQQKPIDPQLLEGSAGMAEHTKAAKLMAEAVRFGKAGETAAAVEQMNLAEEALKDNEEQIFTVITMLHGLSTIEVLATSPLELTVLLEVLALASDQRQIYQQTRFGKEAAMPDLVKRQQNLEPRYLKLVQNDAPHPMLVKAQQFNHQAMEATSRDKSVEFLTIADEALRQYIIEQALILDTSLKPGSSSSDPVITEAETDDLSVSDLASGVSDFVSGEAPKDKRTEWEVLGTRNRAALNQNFARELPLEFRGMLKDYYEKVAK